jgi:hypothetical protein
MTGRVVSAISVAMLSAALASAEPARKQGRTRQTASRKVMQIFAQRGEWDKVKQLALADVWRDIVKPWSLQKLVIAFEKLGDREQAGAFCHILLRVLELPATASAPSTPTLKRWAEARLRRLDVEFDKIRKQHAASAPHRKFTAPEAVGESWMTAVHADPQCLWGLIAWKLVGGRKDAKPDWIHNRQGEMHRSCLKLMQEVDGRQGVLYAGTFKPADTGQSKELAAHIQRLGHNQRITLRNTGKCRFLRAGIKAQKFPLIFHVEAEGEALFSQKVGPNDWSDLKIDLGESAGKDVTVYVQLLVPPGQRPHFGGWIDYLDFFDN